MARSFSSHCRSAREDSAEYPASGCSSATTCEPTGASEAPAKKMDAISALRFIRPPGFALVFCLNGRWIGNQGQGHARNCNIRPFFQQRSLKENRLSPAQDDQRDLGTVGAPVRRRGAPETALDVNRGEGGG